MKKLPPKKPLRMNGLELIASIISKWAGRPIAFLSSILLIIVWAITGSLFKYNDTWQLVINTTTSVVTFIMVFIIQNAQNRDSIALNLKLDQLILINKNTNNDFINIEDEPQSELEHIKYQFDSNPGQ